jgi:ribose 5-phosphate isomerase A
VAEAGAALVLDGMIVGLGTGSTTNDLLDALARRAPRAQYVASSPATWDRARRLKLAVRSFLGPEAPARLDLALDGADEVAPDGWSLKGGGGAHTREKLVVRAAERVVLLVSSDKVVRHLTRPVPVELLPFGLAATLRALGSLGEVVLRNAPPSPDGGLLADVALPLEDPERAARALEATPGVMGHGLFGPDLVTEVLVARGTAIETLALHG